MDTDVSVTAIWWVSSEWSKMARNDKTICPLQNVWPLQPLSSLNSKPNGLISKMYTFLYVIVRNIMLILSITKCLIEILEKY